MQFRDRSLIDKVQRVGVFVIVILVLGAYWAYQLLPSSTWSGGQDESAVRAFMQQWKQGPASADSELDSRSPQVAKDLLHTIHINNFDGNLSDAGDTEITVYATGEQYPVHDFRVTPVVDLAGAFVPLSMIVSVTKDTHQVFSVKPE